MDCIFCKIVAGQVEAPKIYENDSTFVFLSNSPNNLGHSLVIPKKHFENIYEIDENTLAEVAKTFGKVANAIKKSLNAKGVNIIQNNERAGGQGVFHIHFHVIPRYQDDDFDHWKQFTQYKKGEENEYVERIRKNLA
ncbi:MAG: HIT family protein [Candidatus Taylorbacteria bacterium]|nr:HIT family protein [Candidatus Taylorbacteria bacterium]